jgi:Fe-S-cluster containining protein
MTTDPDGPAVFDCRSCGACCHARDGTLLVSPVDLVRWKRTGRSDVLEKLTDGHFGQKAFGMSERGACVHLGLPGAEYDCSIYETRAVVCRAFEVGNPQCLEARKERGLPSIALIEGASMAGPQPGC